MTSNFPQGSLLLEPARHPLLPAESVAVLGSVAVIAPHPDDESLGCGGLLGLLADRGQAALVVVMTDGSLSHPKSLSHPAPRLAAVREAETRDAIEALGLPRETARFLRFGDCALPAEDQPGFAEAATLVRETLEKFAPDTIFVPWRRDPHRDHEATWLVVRTALTGSTCHPRWFEYPVWAWTQATGPVAPQNEEAAAWRLDISSAIVRKQRAIAQHRSQLGALIHDDPQGFALEPATLVHFTRPWELFLDPIDGRPNTAH